MLSESSPPPAPSALRGSWRVRSFAVLSVPVVFIFQRAPVVFQLGRLALWDAQGPQKRGRHTPLPCSPTGSFRLPPGTELAFPIPAGDNCVPKTPAEGLRSLPVRLSAFFSSFNPASLPSLEGGEDLSPNNGGTKVLRGSWVSGFIHYMSLLVPGSCKRDDFFECWNWWSRKNPGLLSVHILHLLISN